MSMTLKELEALMDRNGIEERIRQYVRQCISFHNWAAPGLLIGVFMVDLALEKLGASQTISFMRWPKRRSAHQMRCK